MCLENLYECGAPRWHCADCSHNLSKNFIRFSGIFSVAGDRLRRICVDVTKWQIFNLLRNSLARRRLMTPICQSNLHIATVAAAPQIKSANQEERFFSQNEFRNRSIQRYWRAEAVEAAEAAEERGTKGRGTNADGIDATKHLFDRRKFRSINNCLLFSLSLSTSIAWLVWLVITFRCTAGRFIKYSSKHRCAERERTSKRIINF